MNVRFAMMGRNYQLHGVPDEIELPDEAMLADALERFTTCLPDGERLPNTCLIAIGNDHLGTVASFENRRLRDGDEVILFVPVAGG
ncbi:MAG: MoaD/ThiS family protein [Pirellulaceae bacterium]|nr:MoaD/ThiS family protein [Planctomycetales bacterium]MCA9202137.1 MoaD/ThiS family protein [Planctomycetales bacterium]MCA9219259.1 MoaD/ThiS family protein [Planctomycetales bacterium]